MRKYIISDEEYQTVKAYSKRNKDKKTDKRLQVIILRYEGMKDVEIAEKLGFNRQVVSMLCREFCQKGLEEYAKKKYGGNHRSLSLDEETAILNSFSEKANKGEIVCVQDIKAEFDRRIGKDTGRGYIYMLLKRHGWRKIMPRSKHPKKANEEAIEASKKLTPQWKPPLA